MSNIEFRKQVAGVFNKCVQIERGDIFGENDPIPLSNQDDARVMFPGLVSDGYIPGEGIIIMAINPAGGGDNDTRIPTDHELYRAMNEFKKASGDGVCARFEELNKAALESEKSWGGLTKYINAILDAAGRQNNHVYMNAVPYRVRGDKANAIPREAFTKVYDKIVSKQLEILKPKAIVVLGKTTDNILGRYYRDKAPGYYVIPGTIGWRYITKEAEAAIGAMSVDLGSIKRSEEYAYTAPVETEEPVERNIEKVDADIMGAGKNNTDSEFIQFLEEGYGRIYLNDIQTFNEYIGRLKNEQLEKIVKNILLKVLSFNADIKIRAFHKWLEVRYALRNEADKGIYFFGIYCKRNGYRLAFKPTDINLHPIELDHITNNVVDGPWRVLDCGNYPEDKLGDLIEVAERSFSATVNP